MVVEWADFMTERPRFMQKRIDRQVNDLATGPVNNKTLQDWSILNESIPTTLGCMRKSSQLPDFNEYLVVA